MNDDENDMEPTNDHDNCDCVVCQLNRINREVQANGAANARRSLWLDVYVAAVRAESPSPGNAARKAVMDFDAAFPEVKNAAMEETR